MRPPELPVDTLDGGAVEVVILEDAHFGGGAVREPHRHAYHELLWIRAGSGEHAIDGVRHPVVAGAITVIGRGQVHVFEQGSGLHGAVVRFGEDVVLDEGGRAAPVTWLLTARGERTVPVPAGDAVHLDALIATLAAESARPRDACSTDVERHLLTTILLWIERWYDGGRTEHPADDDGMVQVHRRFTERLERDYVRHHDAAHYAQALAMPGPALSRALARVTGQTTKELITARVMLEARRLLRFTDLGVGAIAHRVGFSDPLYFSRAFKRDAGEAPLSFRARTRGRA
jgi:AraC family transcriptional activator of pobA